MSSLVTNGARLTSAFIQWCPVVFSLLYAFIQWYSGTIAPLYRGRGSYRQPGSQTATSHLSFPGGRYHYQQLDNSLVICSLVPLTEGWSTMLSIGFLRGEHFQVLLKGLTLDDIYSIRIYTPHALLIMRKLNFTTFQYLKWYLTLQIDKWEVQCYDLVVPKIHTQNKRRQII